MWATIGKSREIEPSGSILGGEFDVNGFRVASGFLAEDFQADLFASGIGQGFGQFQGVHCSADFDFAFAGDLIVSDLVTDFEFSFGG